MVRDTAAGRYEIAWEYREDGGIAYYFHIPFDCEALIILPGKKEFTVYAGEYHWIGVYCHDDPSGSFEERLVTNQTIKE
jgi:hypothetical protein